MRSPAVYAVATLDSKGREMAFLAQCARDAGAITVLVDVGIKEPPVVVPQVTRDFVAARHPRGADWVFRQVEKSAALKAMGESLTHYLLAEFKEGKVAGVVGMGGSEGSSLIAPALQALPVGIPKLLVSTLASGDVSPYVGISDLTLVHPVVDLAGLNRISRPVLRNAGHAIAGMALAPKEPMQSAPAAGLTMFGVTTPCVERVRHGLEERGWDALVFHAVGSGGKALETYAEQGLVQAILDITTTEIADEVVGGIFRSGPDRLDVLARRAIPAVISLGALDMVNFGAMNTMPAAFRGRNLLRHTPLITLMRTTAEECRIIARWMADKLNRAVGPVAVVIP